MIAGRDDVQFLQKWECFTQRREGAKEKACQGAFSFAPLREIILKKP